MAINLLQLPLLKPKITSSTVSIDGHDVSNLLALPVPSLRSGSRGEGFIAETFIKPPVNITITFACNVDIERIIVDGRIGSQRSTGMEVYTASVQQRLDSRPINFDLVTFQCVGRAYLPNDPEFSLVNQNSQRHNEDIKSNESCVFTFFNRRFRSRLRSDATINVELGADSRSETKLESNVYEMKHRLNHHLSAVSAICLRITKTLNGSAVTVRRIEVWGQISGLRDATPIAETDSVSLANSKMSWKMFSRQLSNKDNMFKDNTFQNTSSSFLSDTSSFSNPSEHSPTLPANTPPEFLDAITHEVMTFSLLLPCGQIVDKITLDRFCKEEAVWGRSPSDPFTGSPFTSDTKPVVSDALKARLDLFILRNADEIWNKSDNRSYVLGRAVVVDKTSALNESPEGAASCSGNKLIQSHSVDLESPASPAKKRFKASAHRDGHIKHVLNIASDVVSLSSEDSDLESSDDSSCDILAVQHPEVVLKNSGEYSIPKNCIDLSDDDDECIDLTDDNRVVSNGLSKQQTSSAYHESAVTSSLESALHSTLATLPSFTRAKPTNPKLSVAACSKCDGRDTSVLYTLACQHLICRRCLVASMKSGSSEEVPPVKCSTCDAVIATHLATKAHFPQ